MIELMKKDDLTQVVAIENDSFSKPWNRDYFIHEIDENEFAQLFVYRLNEEIIGYVDLWYMFENCDLTKIAIKKEFRNQGYGDKMLKFTMTRSKRFSNFTIQW